MIKKNYKDRFAYFLWDLWCVVSVVGLWPRFIEPRLLWTTKKKLTLSKLNSSLSGLRVVQFGDLHLAPHMSDRYLKKIERKIKALQPDVLLFSGDFLCYSMMHDWERLSRFLNTLSAPHGCFASLGNHDYATYAALAANGKRAKRSGPAATPLAAGIKRLFLKQEKIQYEDCSEPLPLHEKLCETLRNSPFRLLENETASIEHEGAKLNITGLGDLWAGNFFPERAFEQYDHNAPGIVLSHNPDTLANLAQHPGDLILSGHTHGGQINLPWFRKRFLSLQNMKHFRGEHRVGSKTLYVNRGCGSVFHFRWRSVPELTLYELEASQ